MKKIMLAVLLLAGIASYAGTVPVVNEKVLKAFKETFTNAENVIWQEYENYYQANFWQKDINIRVKYDEEGNVLGTIRYYFENNLPPNLLAKLKKKYNGKKIYGITEVASESEMLYVIKLEDDKYWYTVNSDSLGNMQITEKFKKA